MNTSAPSPAASSSPLSPERITSYLRRTGYVVVYGMLQGERGWFVANQKGRALTVLAGNRDAAVGLAMGVKPMPEERKQRRKSASSLARSPWGRRH